MFIGKQNASSANYAIVRPWFVRMYVEKIYEL